jgi:hypothetical protein
MRRFEAGITIVYKCTLHYASERGAVVLADGQAILEAGISGSVSKKVPVELWGLVEGLTRQARLKVLNLAGLSLMINHI